MLVDNHKQRPIRVIPTMSSANLRACLVLLERSKESKLSALPDTSSADWQEVKVSLDLWQNSKSV